MRGRREPRVPTMWWDDVSEHLSQLRRYYFDVVAADRDEVTVTVRRKEQPRPIGFRPRGKR